MVKAAGEQGGWWQEEEVALSKGIFVESVDDFFFPKNKGV